MLQTRAENAWKCFLAILMDEAGLEPTTLHADLLKAFGDEFLKLLPGTPRQPVSPSLRGHVPPSPLSSAHERNEREPTTPTGENLEESADEAGLGEQHTETQLKRLTMIQGQKNAGNDDPLEVAGFGLQEKPSALTKRSWKESGLEEEESSEDNGQRESKRPCKQPR